MRTMRTSAVLAAAFVGMFVGTARAEEKVEARVPFAFVVRGQEFPAGRYDISTREGILSVRGMDHGGGVFAMATAADGNDPIGDHPVLVFVRRENEYLLSQVWQSKTEGQAILDVSGVPHREASVASTRLVAANLK